MRCSIAAGGRMVGMRKRYLPLAVAIIGLALLIVGLASETHKDFGYAGTVLLVAALFADTKPFRRQLRQPL